MIYQRDFKPSDHCHAPNLWNIVQKNNNIETAKMNLTTKRKAKSIANETYLKSSTIRLSSGEKQIRSVIKTRPKEKSIDSVCLSDEEKVNIIHFSKNLVIFSDKELLIHDKEQYSIISSYE